MESITTAEYAVHFNQEAFEALNAHLRQHSYSSIFILVDENTHECCYPYLISRLETKIQPEILEIEAGEENKNIHTCTQLWEALSELGADRKSLLINLGGGVLTDLGGFVAATFKRGIPFINIPTTLLAMVDASIGGKTGVDLGPLKNQIGVIRQPEMVLVVSSFLSTLEERQIQSGFAEMLKHGLIRSESYWEALKGTRGLSEIDPLIYESVGIKNEVVLKDPTEQGIRKVLNFGHTLGHAIESHFLEKPQGQQLLHGEAIAVGMVLEAWLSTRLTGLPVSDLEDIRQTFDSRYPKVQIEDKDIEPIVNLMKFDKKNSHGNINFVLLKSIGDPEFDVTVPPDLYAQAFAYYSGS